MWSVQRCLRQTPSMRLKIHEKCFNRKRAMQKQTKLCHGILEGRKMCICIHVICFPLTPVFSLHSDVPWPKSIRHSQVLARSSTTALINIPSSDNRILKSLTTYLRPKTPRPRPHWGEQLPRGSWRLETRLHMNPNLTVQEKPKFEGLKNEDGKILEISTALFCDAIATKNSK